jgi:hypothetical protein
VLSVVLKIVLIVEELLSFVALKEPLFAAFVTKSKMVISSDQQQVLESKLETVLEVDLQSSFGPSL